MELKLLSGTFSSLQGYSAFNPSVFASGEIYVPSYSRICSTIS